MSLFFSVLITAYNYGCYIEDAIQSALDQTLARDQFEVIVIDDGSEDDTAERVSKFGHTINYIYQENAGQAAAFNAGLSIANGEFVAFLDADDIWNSDKLEYLKNYLDSHVNVDLVYHSLTMVDDKGELLGVYPKYGNADIITDPLNSLLSNGLPEAAATSGIVCRMRTLRHLLPIPLDYRICADSYIAVTSPFVVSNIGFINKPLAIYRLHVNNGYSIYDMNTDRYSCKKANILLEKVKLDLKSVESASLKFGIITEAYCSQFRYQVAVHEIFLCREQSGLFNAFCQLIGARNHLACRGTVHLIYRLFTISIRLLLGAELFHFLAKRYVGSKVHLYIHELLNSRMRPAINE